MVRKQLAEEIDDILCHSLMHLILGKTHIVRVEVAVCDFRDAHCRFLAIVANCQFANPRVARWQPDYGIRGRGERKWLAWKCFLYGGD